MKVLHSWLQDYLAQPVTAEQITDALTYHSSEIESVEDIGNDKLIDVKVLPDRAHDMLSHRGIARELAAILHIDTTDAAKTRALELPASQSLEVNINTDACTRYAAALIQHIQIGPSPTWLRERLERLGQRSINNVVDATNYVMFSVGQPLHAFDADKITKKDGTRYCIEIRDSRDNEKLVTLDGVDRTVSAGIPLIADCTSNIPLALAGVKGGQAAEVTARTHAVIIESANFDSVRVRKAAKQLGIRTDASVRFENHVSPALVPEGIMLVAELIAKIAGTDKTTIEGYVDAYPKPWSPKPVSISLKTVHDVLGAPITAEDVTAILERVGCTVEHTGSGSDVAFTITPPPERLDIEIPEDVVDVLARLWGYDNLEPRMLEPHDTAGVRPVLNKAFFYTSLITDTLIALGFTEVSTYTFRSEGKREVLKALASDKQALRSNLIEGMREALELNIRNADLLGFRQVKLFEIGTVFSVDAEHVALSLGVLNTKGVKEKEDAAIQQVLVALNEKLGVHIAPKVEKGIVEINLHELIETLPEPSAAEYATLSTYTLPQKSFVQFSIYPFSVRDVAVWVPLDVTAETIQEIITRNAGSLLVRIELFDTFKKEIMPGVTKLSYAFRLVLQSPDHTLTEEEITGVLSAIYAECGTHEGWTVR